MNCSNNIYLKIYAQKIIRNNNNVAVKTVNVREPSTEKQIN